MRVSAAKRPWVRVLANNAVELPFVGKDECLIGTSGFLIPES